jgi:hypothetical protein
MHTPIPAEWRLAVCRVLSCDYYTKVDVEQAAWDGWDDLFPTKPKYQILNAFLRALRDPVVLGEQITTDAETDCIFKFIFWHCNKRVCGTINLLSDCDHVIICSLQPL